MQHDDPPPTVLDLRNLSTRWRRLGSRLLVVLLLAAGLAAWRWEIIDSPPYWDFAMGLFREADFLTTTGFDYHRLRTSEAHFNAGGPAYLITSVAPTMLAVSMRLCEPQTTLVVYHLVAFLGAALLCLAMFELVRPGIGALGAVLVTAAMLTTPLLRAQIDLVGLDLPMCVLSIVAIWLVVAGHGLWGALAATGAFFIKPTAAITTLGLVIYWMLFGMGAILRRDRDDMRRSAISLFGSLAALVLQIAVYRWGGQSSWYWEIPGDEVGVSAAAAGSLAICPDLMLLIATAAIGTLIAGLFGRFRPSDSFDSHGVESHGPQGLLGRAATILKQQSLATIAWIVIAGNLAAVILYAQISIPRYYTLLVPCLYLAIGALIRSLGHMGQRLALSAVALVAIVNLWNAHGRLFPQVSDRSGAALERSLEYLADHQSNIRAIRTLEADADGGPVVAAQPFTNFLAFPSLGYVAQPIGGYALNPILGTRFADLSQILVDRPPRLRYLTVDNGIYRGTQVLNCLKTPETEGGTAIYDDQQPSPLVIWQFKRPAELVSIDERIRWYFDLFWQPTICGANALLVAGLSDQFIQVMSEAIEAHRDEPGQRTALAIVLAERGRTGEARRHLLQVIDEDPADVEALGQLGKLSAGEEQWDEALRYFELALAIEPDNTVLIGLRERAARAGGPSSR